MESYQIFISYRRNGGEYLAGRLADRFKALGYKVFYDVESMCSGTFNTQILNAIAECNDVLLVLPPNALDRCVNEDDWVRQELAFALKHNKNIIPVMMKDFSFPEILPADIEAVKYIEGITASIEYFDAVIERIEKFLISDKCQKSESKPNNLQFTKDSITEGIDISELLLDNKYILIIKNNSGFDISVSAKTIFYCQNYDYTDTKLLKVIKNKGETCLCFDNYHIKVCDRIDCKITSSQITSQISATDYIDYKYGVIKENGIEYEADHMLTLTNTGDITITGVTVGVLFFYNGAIIGYNEVNFSTLYPGQEKNECILSEDIANKPTDYLKFFVTGCIEN